jgi:integrase
MPANYLMSWEPTRRRWWKMENGKRHVVSVRQLRKFFNDHNIQETKESSYQHANAWWQERQRSEPRSRRSGFDADGSFLMEVTPSEAQALMVVEAGDRGLPIPDAVKEAVLGKARREELGRQVDAILNPVKPPSDRTIVILIGRYLDMLLSRHRAGEISVGEYANQREALFYFGEWFGPESPIDDLTPDKWESYFLHLIGDDAPKSINTRKKRFGYARNFIRWIDDSNIHPAPKNLDRKQHRFKGGSQAVPTIGSEVVKATINGAKGQLKLHLLLMTNCGFTQQDIADLHPSEVDWESGRIRRQRSKTSGNNKVPVVDYPLWNDTFRLLQQYRSTDPTHVLLTESGKTWVRDDIGENGRRSRVDAINRNYRKLDVKGKQPMKMFRKASSTLLDSSPDYGRYAIHFLGHAPDIAHRHYISSNGSSFDAAIRWLGEQFGF